MIYYKLNGLKFSPAKICPNKFNYLLRGVAGAISKRGFLKEGTISGRKI